MDDKEKSPVPETEELENQTTEETASEPEEDEDEPRFITVMEGEASYDSVLEEDDVSKLLFPKLPKLHLPFSMRGIAAIAVTVILVALAVLVFVFRDQLTGEKIRSSFRRDPVSAQSDAYTYEIGSSQVFVPAGSGFAVASSSAVELLDSDGKTVYKQVVSFEVPAAFACPSRALFCDLGGTGCILAGMDGESSVLQPEGELITAGMNENGWYILVTDAVGYKGLVSVYDADGALKYEWWSGAGYVMKAAISPDNRVLAVLTAENGGGKLHLFRLDKEEELALAEFAQELPFDFAFMGNDNLCVVSVDALSFVTLDGNVKNRFELGNNYLLDYELGSPSFAAICTSTYRSGSNGVIQTLDRDGKLLGSSETTSELICLSASGKQLLVMTSGGLALYSHDMILMNSSEELMTAKKALLCPDGHILLLSAYSAERLSY